MLKRSVSLAMSTSVLKALSGNLISKDHEDTHLVFSMYKDETQIKNESLSIIYMRPLR